MNLDIIALTYLMAMLVLVLAAIICLDEKPPRREKIGRFGMGQIFGKEVAL